MKHLIPPIALSVIGLVTPISLMAQVLDSNPLGSLKHVSVPEPAELDRFVKDRNKLTVLGKALFWDSRAGLNGQSCATCHFHAGADSRIKNQISPHGASNITAFNSMPRGAGGPNYRLKTEDWPLYVLSDIRDRHSDVVFDTDDVISSQGVYQAALGPTPGPITGLDDECSVIYDPIFSVNNLNTRRVEPRNSPTVINAAFNFRQFWDGRANNRFNGVDIFGDRNQQAKVLRRDGTTTVWESISLENSSLASQAVGPPLSLLEMSCDGRQFSHVARKLFAKRPLRHQSVAPSDSVLGNYVHDSGKGLNASYRELIRQSFKNDWWKADVDINGFNQMETNFSLFWGLALQAYQNTLISDDAPFDRFMDGDSAALTDAQKRGLAVFTSKGKCIACHNGPEFTSAASHLQGENDEGGLVERMPMAKLNGNDAFTALYDNGFYNIGATPTLEDIGAGGVDPWGNPLSFTRQEKFRAGGLTQLAPDPFFTDPEKFEVNSGTPVDPNERDAVDGSFKTPTLRNVELTGPYFHDGGKLTLRQVVEFYNRGGDRRDTYSDGSNECDTTGYNDNCSNLDPDIESLDLSNDEIEDLVAFMESLTDDRVRWEKAPFDHPSLRIPLGHVGNIGDTKPDLNETIGIVAKSITMKLPAVGSAGRGELGLGPLPKVEELVACSDDTKRMRKCFVDYYTMPIN